MIWNRELSTGLELPRLQLFTKIWDMGYSLSSVTDRHASRGPSVHWEWTYEQETKVNSTSSLLSEDELHAGPKRWRATATAFKHRGAFCEKKPMKHSVGRGHTVVFRFPPFRLSGQGAGSVTS